MRLLSFGRGLVCDASTAKKCMIMMEVVEAIYPYQPLSLLKGERILVFAPHPDDETIGCGGSILLHSRIGSHVKVIILTDGGAGDFLNCYTTKEKYIAERKKEASKACKILGVKELEFWSYPDQELCLNSINVLKDITRTIESFKPHVVYCPAASDSHLDHQVTYQSVFQVSQNINFITTLASYEISPPLVVNCYVDITSVWKAKRRALRKYKSQINLYSYDEGHLGLNKYRAINCRHTVTYVEAFNVHEFNK